MSENVNLFARQAEQQTAKVRERKSKIPNENSAIKCRRGKIGTTIHLHADAHRVLKTIAFDEEKNMTALLIEGVNLMFQHYGKKPIA